MKCGLMTGEIFLSKTFLKIQKNIGNDYIPASFDITELKSPGKEDI